MGNFSSIIQSALGSHQGNFASDEAPSQAKASSPAACFGQRPQASDTFVLSEKIDLNESFEDFSLKAKRRQSPLGQAIAQLLESIHQARIQKIEQGNFDTALYSALEKTLFEIQHQLLSGDEKKATRAYQKLIQSTDLKTLQADYQNFLEEKNKDQRQKLGLAAFALGVILTDGLLLLVAPEFFELMSVGSLATRLVGAGIHGGLTHLISGEIQAGLHYTTDLGEDPFANKEPWELFTDTAQSMVFSAGMAKAQEFYLINRMQGSIHRSKVYRPVLKGSEKEAKNYFLSQFALKEAQGISFELEQASVRVGLQVLLEGTDHLDQTIPKALLMPSLGKLSRSVWRLKPQESRAHSENGDLWKLAFQKAAPPLTEQIKTERAQGGLSLATRKDLSRLIWIGDRAHGANSLWHYHRADLEKIAQRKNFHEPISQSTVKTQEPVAASSHPFYRQTARDLFEPKTPRALGCTHDPQFPSSVALAPADKPVSLIVSFDQMNPYDPAWIKMLQKQLPVFGRMPEGLGVPEILLDPWLRSLTGNTGSAQLVLGSPASHTRLSSCRNQAESMMMQGQATQVLINLFSGDPGEVSDLIAALDISAPLTRGARLIELLDQSGGVSRAEMMVNRISQEASKVLSEALQTADFNKALHASKLLGWQLDLIDALLNHRVSQFKHSLPDKFFDEEGILVDPDAKTSIKEMVRASGISGAYRRLGDALLVEQWTNTGQWPKNVHELLNHSLIQHVGGYYWLAGQEVIQAWIIVKDFLNQLGSSKGLQDKDIEQFLGSLPGILDVNPGLSLHLAQAVNIIYQTGWRLHRESRHSSPIFLFVKEVTKALIARMADLPLKENEGFRLKLKDLYQRSRQMYPEALMRERAYSNATQAYQEIGDQEGVSRAELGVCLAGETALKLGLKVGEMIVTKTDIRHQTIQIGRYDEGVSDKELLAISEKVRRVRDWDFVAEELNNGRTFEDAFSPQLAFAGIYLREGADEDFRRIIKESLLRQYSEYLNLSKFLTFSRHGVDETVQMLGRLNPPVKINEFSPDLIGILHEIYLIQERYVWKEVLKKIRAHNKESPPLNIEIYLSLSYDTTLLSALRIHPFLNPEMGFSREEIERSKNVIEARLRLSDHIKRVLNSSRNIAPSGTTTAIDTTFWELHGLPAIPELKEDINDLYLALGNIDPGLKKNPRITLHMERIGLASLLGYYTLPHLRELIEIVIELPHSGDFVFNNLIFQFKREGGSKEEIELMKQRFYRRPLSP